LVRGKKNSNESSRIDDRISIIDLLDLRNAALLRILMLLRAAGDKGIPTVQLLNRLNSTNYGQRMIKLGEKNGYVERVKVKVPKGQKGNIIVINRLTPKGKLLMTGVPPNAAWIRDQQQ
jgi:hypothetical protein